MKIPGLTMSSPLAAHAAGQTSGAHHHTDVRCDAQVYVERAFFSHHGVERNYRPYLHLMGELRSLRPEEPIGQVEELTFTPNLGMPMNVFYELDDDELAALVTKGYFTDKFSVPPVMSDVVYEFPVTSDLLVLHPVSEADVPVVFCSVHDQNSLTMDTPSSGYYDLVGYFEDVREYAAEATDARYVDGMADIFENEPLDITTEAVERTVAAKRIDVHSSFADLVEQHEAQAAQEAGPVEPDADEVAYAGIAERLSRRLGEEPEDDVVSTAHADPHEVVEPETEVERDQDEADDTGIEDVFADEQPAFVDSLGDDEDEEDSLPSVSESLGLAEPQEEDSSDSPTTRAARRAQLLAQAERLAAAQREQDGSAPELD